MYLLYSDTRLEIDLQSIAECNDLLETQTSGRPHAIILAIIVCLLLTGSCDTGSCDSGSCDLGSDKKGTKYKEQQVEVEVFSYKFSQRERKVL